MAREPSVEAILDGVTVGRESRSLISLGRALSRLVDEVATDYELTADLWLTLEEITKSDGITMTELARKLAIPAPTVTKLVDHLVSRALVFRLADQADRRRVFVHASRLGDRIHQQLGPEVRRVEREFLQGLK
ncbi:MarR family transcriptional regulator [Dietzia sp. CQ4]|uniref:MarR family transcriptional regulator n=1 Tax=Dietzia sp. (strain CQ4) TaxID=370437 RepID=UPI00321FFED5